MKLVVVCYNIAIHEEVIEALEEAGIKNYTRFERTQGVGDLSGPHLGTNVWPALNSVMMIVVDEERKDKFLAKVRELREVLGREGVKAFVLPVDEVM